MSDTLDTFDEIDKKSLKKRRISIVVATAIILLGIGGCNFLTSQKTPPPKEEQPEAIKEVRTLSIENSTIATSIDVQGELVAYNKIDIFSEVTGPLKSSNRSFKVGTYFPKGSVLINVDNTEMRLSIQAQKSTLLNAVAQMMPDLKIDYPESFPQWEAYLTAFDLDEKIKDLPAAVSEREKLFVATRNIHTQFYNIKSAEQRLSKYTSYAPFGGVLTAASVNPGAVVLAGQKLGELMAIGQYELVATVLLSELAYIKIGNKVSLSSIDLDGEWTGTVKRISDQIDAASQTVKVFIDVNGKSLKEGMYLTGQVAASTINDVVEIDRALLLSDNEVYVIKEGTLQTKQVEVVRMKRSTALVKGLSDGEALLAHPVAGAYGGMKVKIAK